MKFWALPAWSRILFQCTTEFKEYQEYPYGFSMDLQPLGIPGSSTCLRPPDGRTRGGTGGTTLECPSCTSRVQKSATFQPHHQHQFPKNSTKRNSGLCKAPTPSWSSTQGGSLGFPAGKKMEKTRQGRMEQISGKESQVWGGFVSAGFPWAWKKFPSATFGIGISPLPILWMGGIDRSARIKAGKRSPRER